MQSFGAKMAGLIRKKKDKENQTDKNEENGTVQEDEGVGRLHCISLHADPVIFTFDVPGPSGFMGYGDLFCMVYLN